jgi:PiT family inorganic phosphate transporter
MIVILALLAIFAGLYMAWNIGANDVANSMSTAVGSNAITLRQALIIASILNFLGAVLVGKHVTDTIQNKIVDVALIADHELMLGFMAALLSAGIFVTLSTWKELPVSTTHAVIGGIIGFGLIEGGMSMVKWGTVENIAASWVISPIAGGVLAFIMFKVIAATIFSSKEPGRMAKNTGPIFITLTLFIIMLSVFMKTKLGAMMGDFTVMEFVAISLGIASLGGIIGFFLLKRVKGKGYDLVENLFRRLQVMTSCYIAFSHGANDVANAVAPVAMVLMLAWKQIDAIYLLAIGGLGIAVGILTWGYKVIKTVGGKITALTNTRGFSIDFSAATVVLVASKLGLPISTTHTVVGAVIGVGLARGLDAVDLSVIKKIVYSWLLTLPASAALSILIYRGLIILF